MLYTSEYNDSVQTLVANSAAYKW